MSRFPLRRSVATLLTALLCALPLRAAPGQGQQSTPPPTGTSTTQSGKPQQTPPEPTVQLPQSQLDQIKRAVLTDTKLQLRGDPLRFYVTVEARIPSVQEMLGTYDLKNGPVARAPMRHQEYLNMVTPQELYGSGGITALELLQGAVVNALGHWLVRKAMNDLGKAENEREVQEIRERIERELAALRGGGS
jgi:hypothetical protein